VTRRRALAPALLAGCLVVLVGACAEEVARGDLPISDDFSGDCDGWSADNDEHIALGCEDGAYKAVFKRADERPHHMIPRRTEEPSSSVGVEADATLQAFTGDTGESFEGHGVGCWSSPADELAQGYLFVVSPSVQAFAIIRHDETDESLRNQFYFRPLIEEESEAVAAIGETGRLRGECRATDDGVELTMYLDGQQVGTVTDPRGFRDFEAFGFVVISTEAGTEIGFDNFEAEELGE
jgi:hypothetical protein